MTTALIQDHPKAVSLRVGLRQGTAEAHERLDRLVGDMASRAGYHSYLRGQFAFRHAAEEYLNGLSLPSWFNHWAPLGIADAILSDMNDLSLEVASPPVWPATGIPASPSSLLGMFYVLEGAALGARILQRRAESLGLGEAFGARHLFRQTSDKTGWKQLLALLERPGLDNQAAIQTANLTFGVAIQAFERQIHE